MSATVKASPISRTAAILIIALGVLTLVAGLATGTLADTVAGVAFVLLGLFLYKMLYRFGRKIARELDGEE
ncbi:MAG: hypothetical protein HY296_05360 [Thaumarchaeota archaeon]|nr:hypothetical protein [Nitrososphaerota archaeon]